MFLNLLALLGIIRWAEAQTWNYTLAGRDWSGNACLSSDNLYQSPIDISPTFCTCSSELSLEITFPLTRGFRSNITLSENPPTITTLLSENFAHVYFKTGRGQFRLYKSYQMVFRTPSEHTIDGQSFPMELQIYFKSKYDETMGLSILYEYADKNLEDVIFGDFLAAFERNTTLNQFKFGTSTQFHNYVSYSSLFRDLLDFFQYNGTRTNTDCSFPVNWIVLKKRMRVKKESLESYKAMLKNFTKVETNAREEQELNERMVFESSDECFNVFSNLLSFGFFYSAVIFMVFRMM
jgi:carbonic anhydrase